MKIKRIKLENIGCYRDATFDFSDFSVIRGENRTGKSTLIYAIFFALFGTHLHRGLRANDLCRKGELFGAVSLLFEEASKSYVITRNTEGMLDVCGGEQWSPAAAPARDGLEGAGNPISISEDTAALTSFFREGELIYFLQDIPKYNKTLLQNLMEMDDLLIVKSKFKKALTLAREKRKSCESPLTGSRTDELSIREKREAVAGLEGKLKTVIAECGGRLASPEAMEMLKTKCGRKQKELDDADRLRKKNLPLDGEELKRRIAGLEKALEKKPDAGREKDGLLQRFGSCSRKAGEMQTEISRLTKLEESHFCHTCKQPVSKEKIEALISDLEKGVEKAESERKEIEKELDKIQAEELRAKKDESMLMKLMQQLHEVTGMDGQIEMLSSQVCEAREDLAKFESLWDKKEEERSGIEEKRKSLEKAVIDHKVELRRLEQDLKKSEAVKRDLRDAEKNVSLVKTACTAMDDAIRIMNRGLMGKVGESLLRWSDRFTFLDNFDVNMTAREFNPIIQARGYQYKLNQMSKSERIFLYLMLKLSIGDALSHLGVFLLDDPADGLDEKRKRLMADLIKTVARERQVIITSNDKNFTGFFPEAEMQEVRPPGDESITAGTETFI